MMAAERLATAYLNMYVMFVAILNYPIQTDNYAESLIGVVA